MVVGDMGFPGERPVDPAALAAGAIGEDGYFATSGSALNPRNTGKKWVWGDLPVMLATPLVRLTSGSGLSFELRDGRSLAAVIDTITTGLVVVLALEVGLSGWAALVAGLLYALTPLALQHAHFFVVDPFATCATTGTLILASRLIYRGGWAMAVAAGCAVGIAVACKVSMVLAAVPVGVAALALGCCGHGESWGRWRHARGLVIAAVAGVAAVLFFRLIHPYAFVGPGVLDVRLDGRWWQGLMSAAAQQKAGYDAPWAWQWVGRSPLFFFRNLALWALGPPLAVAGFAGIAWAGVEAWWQRNPRLLVPAGWCVLVFGVVAMQTVKSIRYALPAVPALAVVAAGFLAAMIGADTRWRRNVGVALLVVVLIGTAGFGVALVGLHVAPHPRQSASQWILDHVAPGTVVINESAYDDALPWTVVRNGRFVNGLASGLYEDLRLEVHWPDTRSKLDHMLKLLRRGEVLVVSSNRLRMPIERLPERFPMTTAYYELLESGELGFELVAVFERRPRWFGVVPLDDSRAEEAWRINDHPVVRVYRKGGGFDPDSMARVLASQLKDVRGSGRS